MAFSPNGERLAAVGKNTILHASSFWCARFSLVHSVVVRRPPATALVDCVAFLLLGVAFLLLGVLMHQVPVRSPPGPSSECSPRRQDPATNVAAALSVTGKAIAQTDWRRLATITLRIDGNLGAWVSFKRSCIRHYPPRYCTSSYVYEVGAVSTQDVASPSATVAASPVTMDAVVVGSWSDCCSSRGIAMVSVSNAKLMPRRHRAV